MEIIADLHIHGRYSRGCSRDISLEKLEQWARVKGIHLLGTGDFTHPLWLQHIRETLKEDDSGFLRSKGGFPFVLQTEISLIYSQGGKGRRIHNIVLAPSLAVVGQINAALLKRGRLDYDGRPIFNIPCPEFVGMLKGISEEIEVIPAHAWTPWFSLFGSNSGFDTLKDCFQEQTKHIYAIETGLSSDPEMNWRLSQLDSINLVSFSDIHSYWPWRLGREATIFDIEESYKCLVEAIRTGKGIKATIEADPAYGKYHVDGHRACNVRLEPEEARKLNNICPVCKKPLTIGVMHRVEELADRDETFTRANAPKTYHLLPLSEIIATVLQKGIATKAVWNVYNPLIEKFGNELNILMNVPFEELKTICDERIAELVIKLRQRKAKIVPGYDGVYGNIDGYSNPDAEEENRAVKEADKTEGNKAAAPKAKESHSGAIKKHHSQKGLSDF